MASVLWGQKTASTDVDTTTRQALALSVPDDAPNAGAPYGSIFEESSVGPAGPVGPGDVGGYPENDRDPYTGPVETKALGSGPDDPLFDVSFSRLMQDPEAFLKFEKDQQEKARETQWRNTVAFFGGNVELARDATTGIEPVYPELWFLGGNPVSPLADLAGAGVKGTARAASKVFAVDAARAAGSMVKKDVAALASSVSKALPRGAGRVAVDTLPSGSKAGYVDLDAFLGGPLRGIKSAFTKPDVGDAAELAREALTDVKAFRTARDSALVKMGKAHETVIRGLDDAIANAQTTYDAAATGLADAQNAYLQAQQKLTTVTTEGATDVQTARQALSDAMQAFDAAGQPVSATAEIAYADKAMKLAQAKLAKAEAAYVDTVSAAALQRDTAMAKVIPVKPGSASSAKRVATQTAEIEKQYTMAEEAARTSLDKVRAARDAVFSRRKSALQGKVESAEATARAGEEAAAREVTTAQGTLLNAEQGETFAASDLSGLQSAKASEMAEYAAAVAQKRGDTIAAARARLDKVGQARQGPVFQPNEEIWGPALRFYRAIVRKYPRGNRFLGDPRFNRFIKEMQPLISKYGPQVSKETFSTYLGRAIRAFYPTGNNSVARGVSAGLHGLIRALSPVKANPLNPMGRVLHYLTSPNSMALIGLTTLWGTGALRRVGQMLGLVSSDEDRARKLYRPDSRPAVSSRSAVSSSAERSADLRSVVDRQVDSTGLQQIREDYRRTGDKAAFEAALDRLPEQVRTGLLDEARKRVFAKYFPYTSYERVKSNPRNSSYIEAFDKAFDEVGLSGWAAWDGRAPVPQMERALRRR